MTRGALQRVILIPIAMLGAYGVVQTEREPLGRAIQQFADPLRHAAQTADRALAPGGGTQLRAELLAQERYEAYLFDRSPARTGIAPILKSSDDDRVFGKVLHRAGPVGQQELTEILGYVRHGRSATGRRRRRAA